MMKKLPSATNRTRPGFSRRSFVAGAMTVGAGLALGTYQAGSADAAPAGGTLRIPDLLQGTEIDGVKTFGLTMAKGTTTIAGAGVASAGYNGSILGPTMMFREGETVRLAVTNNLGEETTTHWHGVHLPPSADGGPQNTIAAGTTWSPQFTVKQTEACTLWYHPHALGTTAQQVSLGLAGMIIVDNGSDQNSSLPNIYGTDDIPVIMQSTAITAGTFAATNPALTAGTKHFLVNGSSATSQTPTLVLSKNRVRLRLLNASLTDFIEVSRKGGSTVTQVASDAGLLAAPVDVSTVRLVQGERAEIIIDLTSTDTVTLQATPKDVFNRSRYTVDMLTITTAGSEAPSGLPSTLNTITPLNTATAKTRTLRLAGRGRNQAINDVIGTTIAAMETGMINVGLNDTEVWSVTNGTANLYHSFHLHDVPFQVLSIAGAAPTGANLGWKDTIEVAPGATVKIAMQFTDYTDSKFMYMLHCHNLIHEDAGMMMGLMVTATAANPTMTMSPSGTSSPATAPTGTTPAGSPMSPMTTPTPAGAPATTSPAGGPGSTPLTTLTSSSAGGPLQVAQPPNI